MSVKVPSPAHAVTPTSRGVHHAVAAARLFSPAAAERPAAVYLIAEIGVNHDGSVDRAADLIRAAAAAGADAVKFQLFDPRHLLSRQAVLAEYQKAAAGDVFAMLDALKLDHRQMQHVRDQAAKAGIGFVVSLFSMEDAEQIARLAPQAVKIASPDVVNRPLLEKAASLHLPMIVSTGTAELSELSFAADLIRHHPAGGALLQCVSSYPTPDDEAALGGIAAMIEHFALPVGYSDHTTRETTGGLAVAAGACIIEKHLTHDRSAPGPDHAASFEPDQFARYAALVRAASKMLGPIAKTIQPAEAEVRLVSRQSLCLTRDLPAGHVLGADDLTVKRPGTGIPAALLRDAIGKRLARAVRGNDLLCEGDLSEPGRIGPV